MRPRARHEEYATKKNRPAERGDCSSVFGSVVKDSRNNDIAADRLDVIDRAAACDAAVNTLRPTVVASLISVDEC